MAEETRMTNYSNITIKDLGNSEVEIEGEISAEALAAARTRAVERLSQVLDIPGFRRGKAPENIIIQRIGEYPVLEEAAEIVLGEEYPKILAERAIDAIGRPEITITKLAAGNPLAFKATTAVMPALELPDYTAIAKKKNSKEIRVEVSDADVNDALETIRKNKAHFDLHQKHGKDMDEHDHPEIKDEDLPALDDEFAKSVGGFQTLDELRTKVKENLVKEKEYKAREAVRIEIMDEIVTAMKVSLPQIMITGELDKMLAQFKDDITRAGLSFENYLEQANKTEADLRAEWKEPAAQKAKYQLALNEIAKREKIEADPDVLEHEAKNLADIYKEADPVRLRIYVETMLTNEKVLKFLENTK